MEENFDGQVVKGSIANEKVSRFVREVFDWGGSIFCAVAICTFLTIFIMHFVVVKYSMLPTLHDGDHLLVNKFMYEPKRGDIVTIDTTDKFDKNIVKRVIAVSGDTFKMDYDKMEIQVNGQVLDEPYINEPMKVKGNWEMPATIPNGYVVVMGDNRNHSTDSRDKIIGLVRADAIYGKAFVIYWPFDRFRILA